MTYAVYAKRLAVKRLTARCSLPIVVQVDYLKRFLARIPRAASFPAILAIAFAQRADTGIVSLERKNYEFNFFARGGAP